MSSQAQFTFNPGSKGTKVSGSAAEFELVGYSFVKNTGTTTKTIQKLEKSMVKCTRDCLIVTKEVFAQRVGLCLQKKSFKQ